jgi:carboxymethylenebutenolidase
MTHWLTTRLPDLNAAVPFYGNSPRRKTPPRSRRRCWCIWPVDERINAAWPAYEAALKAAGVNYTDAYQYAGTQHGFNNDTTPRYDATAAKLAWERTVAFFNRQLRA